MSRPKLIRPLADTTEEFNRFKEDCVRTSPHHLSGAFIANFSEDDYDHSIQRAFDDFERYNNDKKNPYIYEMVDYYPQALKHKSILVSYNLKRKDGQPYDEDARLGSEIETEIM